MKLGTMNLRDIIVIEIYKVYHDPCVWEGRYEVITWLLIKKYIFINSIKLFSNRRKAYDDGTQSTLF